MVNTSCDCSSRLLLRLARRFFTVPERGIAPQGIVRFLFSRVEFL